MTKAKTLEGATIYLRYTPGPDKHGKRSTPFCREHRVWDKDLFFRSKDDAERKEGGAIELIDVETYRRESWKPRSTS